MAISDVYSYRSLIPALVMAMIVVLGSARVVAQGSLEERLKRLEDKEAIHSLLERFFEYQESGNRVAYANLFAKNGELILRMGHIKGGPEGILGRNRAARSNQDTQPGAQAPAQTRREPARHVLSNVHIELNGDTATAVSRWTMLAPLEEPRRVRLAGSGTYCDKLVRENGEWKFLQRIIYCEVPAGMQPVH